MDRLEKALEKAKSITHTKEPIEKTRPGKQQFNSEEIVYSQTQQQHLDFEELKQRRIVAQQKYSAEASVFKMLRTKILKQLRGNNWNSFAITAPTQGAGKTMISVNLAIAMAMETNQTILLVDMDLTYPKVHWYFDLKVKAGLRDYLLSDIPLSEILINPGIERLVVLPGRGEVTGSSEMVSGSKMKAMVEEIKNRYKSRIIIFDLPPIIAADDVLATLDYYDAVLLIVEEGGNKPEEVTKAMQMLSGTNILGTVLNKAENPPDQQGYY
jgi:capsular exopolysaccharide synthesis family protein